MSNNTIKLKKYLDVIIEKNANAAITPGMLIESMSSDKVRAHATSEGNAVPIFALEDELQGNGIDDAYAADDPVQCWIAQRGEEVYAILADGEDVAIGDWLASNGDGYLKKHVAETESWEVSEAGEVTVLPLAIVAQAIEALSTADSSGGESSGALGYAKRIQVRIV